MLGGGPVAAGDRTFLSEVAARDAISSQGVQAERMTSVMPPPLRGDAVHVAMVPVLFAQTPVETVDARDVDALAQLVASAIGFGQAGARRAATDRPTRSRPPADRRFAGAQTAFATRPTRP